MGLERQVHKQRTTRFATTAEVDELRQQVRELAELVHRLTSSRSVTVEQVQVVTAVAAATNGKVFSTRAVWRFSQLPDHERLRQVLTEAGVESPQGLAWVLRHARHCGVPGFTIHRHSKSWQIRRALCALC